MLMINKNVVETLTTTCPFTVLTLLSSDQLIPARWTETPGFRFRSPRRTCFSIQPSNHRTLVTYPYILQYSSYIVPEYSYSLLVSSLVEPHRCSWDSASPSPTCCALNRTLMYKNYLVLSCIRKNLSTQEYCIEKEYQYLNLNFKYLNMAPGCSTYWNLILYKFKICSQTQIGFRIFRLENSIFMQFLNCPGVHCNSSDY